MLKKAIVQLHGVGAISKVTLPEFEIAAKNSFPHAFLDFCKTQLSGHVPSSVTITDEQLQWLFTVPPKETLSGISLEDYFSRFVANIDSVVQNREATRATTKRAKQKELRRQEQDAQPKKSKLETSERARQQFEKKRLTFISSIEHLAISQLSKFQFAKYPEWQRREAGNAIRRIQLAQSAIEHMGYEEVAALMSQSLPRWKLVIAEKRKAELERQRKQEYANTLREMDKPQLIQLALSSAPEWKQNAVKKRLDKIERTEFVSTLRGLTEAEVRRYAASRLSHWQRRAIRLRLAQLLEEQKLEYANGLKRLNPNELRRLVTEVEPTWKREVINQRLTQLYREEVTPFVESLKALGITRLHALLNDVGKDWMRTEIEKRLMELQMKQFDQKLTGKKVGELCELAVGNDSDWQRQVICRRIIGQLRKSDLTVLENVAAVSASTLEVVARFAREEIARRKKTPNSANPNEVVIPRYKPQRWV